MGHALNMKREAEIELKDNIIPFWESLRDDEFGGFYGQLDFNLDLNKQADKGCILNSRILWFFSSCFLKFGDEKLLSCARHAYKFMKRSMFDREYGGVIWSATFDGKAADTTKYTYNMAFAIYGLSTYYLASKDEEALCDAISIFNVIETKCKDANGYLESFNFDFTPIPNKEISENGVIAERTMNTLLHVFEGYAGLYLATGDKKVESCLRNIVDIFINKIYNPKLERQEVFFDMDYNSLIDIYSYGHDIETSWLLDWGVSLLDDKELSAKVSKITSALCKKNFELAFCGDSIYCECVKGVDDKRRVWWEEAECVLGFLNEYLKNPKDQAYLIHSYEVFNFIMEHMVDKRAGSEWFNELDENLNPRKMDIVNEWKCPYHNGRMCLEILRRL